MCCTPFPGQRSRSRELFEIYDISALWLYAFLVDSLHMGQNTSREGTMCRTPSPGSTAKGQGHTSRSKFCRVYSMAPWLFDRLTSHEAQIQPMRSWLSRTISRSKVKVQCHPHRSFEVVAIPTLWLHIYFTDSLHIWHKYNPQGTDVDSLVQDCSNSPAYALDDWSLALSHRCALYHFQVERPKNMVTRSFRVFVASAPRFHVYLAYSLHLRHKDYPSVDDMSCTFSRPEFEGHDYTGHWFLNCWLWHLSGTASIRSIILLV